MKRPVKPDIFVKRILSDIRVGELKPREVNELKDFLESAGFERTVTPKTKLSTIYDLWVAEKAKQKAGREKRKKAEKILGAHTQTYWDMMRRKDYARGKGDRKKTKWERAPVSELSAKPFAALKKKLVKIGVNDDETIETILDKLRKLKGIKCGFDAINELSKRVDSVLEAFEVRMNEAREKFSKEPMLLALPDKEFEKLLKNSAVM